MVIERRTQTQIVNSLAQSFPRGRLFEATMIPGSNIRKLLIGLSIEIMRIEDKLIDEIYKGYFINEGLDALLETWESIVGIPDTCFSIKDKTRTERVQQVLVKLSADSVVSAQDFEDLAAILGYNAEVLPGGSSTKALRFTMIINLPLSLAPTDVLPLTLPFTLSGGGSSVVECLFNKLKPANVVIDYNYILPG